MNNNINNAKIIEQTVDELFKKQEEYYEQEVSTDELIGALIENELGIKISGRTFIEDEGVRFEIQNLTTTEIKKIAEKIEEITHSKYDNGYNFYLNPIREEDEIEYIVKETLDFYTNGVSERKTEWLIEEAIMRYGDKELDEESKIEIKNFVIEQC